MIAACTMGLDRRYTWAPVGVAGSGRAHAVSYC